MLEMKSIKPDSQGESLTGESQEETRMTTPDKKIHLAATAPIAIPGSDQAMASEDVPGTPITPSRGLSQQVLEHPTFKWNSPTDPNEFVVGSTDQPPKHTKYKYL